MKRTLRRIGRKLGLLPKQRPSRDHLLKMIPANAICAEIGVWKGELSEQILTRNPQELHLIDPYLFLPEFGDRVYGARSDNDQARMDAVYQEVVDRFAPFANVTLHRDLSENAAPNFADSYFDWIYIDGNHNYEFVKKDLELYLPKVKINGIIAGDDYLFPRCPNGGPKRAVDEFVEADEVELLSVESNQFAIRRLR